MSALSSELKWVDNHCHFEENDEVALDLQEAANKARGVNKKDIDSNTLQGTIGEFGNSITTFSTILLGNFLTQRAINRALNRNMMTEAEVIDKLTMMGRQSRRPMRGGRLSFSGKPKTIKSIIINFLHTIMINHL